MYNHDHEKKKKTQTKKLIETIKWKALFLYKKKIFMLNNEK